MKLAFLILFFCMLVALLIGELVPALPMADKRTWDCLPYIAAFVLFGACVACGVGFLAGA